MRSLICPRCGATHELTGRKRGERFPCSCGQELVTPAPRLSTGKVVALVLAVLVGLPLLVMAGGALVFWWRVRQVPPASDSAFRVDAAQNVALGDEARVNVIALCDAVQMYRAENGVFLVAGPTPREVPRGGQAVPFPHDEAFEKLGFAPGTAVRLQYQVEVREDPVGEPEVICYARGDRDGDGQNSVYSVTLDANGMTSPIQVEREDE
ncbi:hypothetical protein [Hyalangium rubrum]|uniref:Uncharacterized protein n=1 Tax=Hyalangium rubrum TaxID=3103134 RepID=A0ABU5H2U2_9BACT|nr:hypothetical protein [Hyalangium sp. s54d21]MDY7227783.1 hypothetical protein [Hyalangium sp. s54d21]